ncbi:LysM peptidoglycan-binding domain-containing protein [Clostridium haemolyticum]|nr:LysM peptidoglycan-binding domain-containing protein [Clostridium haemolyticum]
MVIYVVKPGDTIYSIGQQYGISANKIIKDNEVKNVNSLVVGETLVLLPEDKEYLVSAGESLYSIAKDYGTTVQSILDANPSITNPSAISIGEIIKIPSTKK